MREEWKHLPTQKQNKRVPQNHNKQNKLWDKWPDVVAEGGRIGWGEGAWG